MKQQYLILSLCILLLNGFTASAQNNFTIAGKITDEKSAPLKSATVFISNSQRITMCNDDGYFRLDHLDAGNYQLTVTMIGYYPFHKDLTIRDNLPDLDIKLKLKQTSLKQINIGGADHWDEYLALFKKEFLGSTENASACEILNPRVLNFNTRDHNLYADADEFLIIENKRLGYRIKYLLKTFRHKQNTVNTAYNGDAVFEELSGSDSQKQEWAKNRLETYQGSMMHFFRAIFKNAALQQGFIVNQMQEKNGTRFHGADLVGFDRPVLNPHAPFMYYAFKDLYITYDPQKAARLLKKGQSAADFKATEILASSINSPAYKSELLLFPKEAVIDARGNVATGYFTTFLILGDWIKKRVGDQLPFEYQPPAKTPATP